MLLIYRLRNLPDFIHAARSAQNISQASIAKKLGVSQAAIAQYEKGRATLSFNTLKKMAPLINMNPDYMGFHSSFNPFKQRDKSQIIKMTLPENTSHEVDYSIPRFIVAKNVRTDVIFLRVSDVSEEHSSRVIKLRNGGFSICAFAMRDIDGNIFLFRRRGKYAFFREDSGGALIPSPPLDHIYLLRETKDISSAAFSQLYSWSNIDSEMITDLFPKPQRKDSVKFMEDLINKVWLLPTGNDKEKKEILAAVENAGEEYYSKVMPSILRELREIARKYAGLTKKNIFG